MERSEKFSSKMDSKLLRELRALADDSRKPIASLLDEAVSEYLARVRIRPMFLDAAKEVMDKNADLLKRLAK